MCSWWKTLIKTYRASVDYHIILWPKTTPSYKLELASFSWTSYLSVGMKPHQMFQASLHLAVAILHLSAYYEWRSVVFPALIAHPVFIVIWEINPGLLCIPITRYDKTGLWLLLDVPFNLNDKTWYSTWHIMAMNLEEQRWFSFQQLEFVHWSIFRRPKSRGG